MAANDAYLIQEGVRRAKLYLLAGHTTTLVDVVNLDDEVIDTIEVNIDQLHARDSTIDLATEPEAWYRYKRIENAVFRGVELPNIRVQRVSGGTPIKDVTVIR